MSYIQFQQRCTACGKTWNAAFGIVGRKKIAEPPSHCPYCSSTAIEHYKNGWKIITVNSENQSE